MSLKYRSLGDIQEVMMFSLLRVQEAIFQKIFPGNLMYMEALTFTRNKKVITFMCYEL